MTNREIYERGYEPAQFARRGGTAYDRTMNEIRDGYVRAFGERGSVLDLGCGTGAFLMPAAEFCDEAIGVDFSWPMLSALKEGARDHDRASPHVVQGDITRLPLRDNTFDLAFSFSTLYTVENVTLALREVARVLRSGGRAVLELGNQQSLNDRVARVQHEEEGLARPHHMTVTEMEEAIEEAGLQIETWRSFQLLPMYGSPRGLRWMAPLLSARWKKLLGTQFRGRMLDEWLSSSRMLRKWAFRQLLVAQKP